METTPVKISDTILTLCKEISEEQPVYVPVMVNEGCVENECFENVDRIVSTYGGKRILGWAIWKRDNILIQAEAHAIWENPQCNLIDITPHSYNEERILFLPDKKLVFNHRIIKSIRKPLTDSVIVKEFIQLLSDRDNLIEDYSVNEHKVEMTKDAAVKYYNLCARINEINAVFKMKVGRNDSCPCGSGLKYKQCCGGIF